VAAHRWALDSSSVTTVLCGRGELERRFDLRLATVPALIVTKTHALVGRRAGKEDKLGSDLLDLVLLLERFDHEAAVSDELAAAPYGLLRLARQLLGAFLADEQQLTRALGLAGRASGGVNVARVHDALRHVLEG
jgi:predicted nucleotidyltransferase